MLSEQRFSAPPSRSAAESAGIPSLVHLLRRGKPAMLHKKCPDLAGKRVLCVGKGRRDQHAVILQNPLDFLLGLSPAAARYAARWTRSPHQKTCPHMAGGTYPARRSAAWQSWVSRFASAIISAEASVASMCAAAFTMCFAINPVPLPAPAPSWLFTIGSNKLIHLFICRPILSHKAVVTSGISVPEILVFWFQAMAPRRPQREHGTEKLRQVRR